jgi:hypothetical protein
MYVDEVLSNLAVLADEVERTNYTGIALVPKAPGSCRLVPFVCIQGNTFTLSFHIVFRVDNLLWYDWLRGLFTWLLSRLLFPIMGGGCCAGRVCCVALAQDCLLCRPLLCGFSLDSDSLGLFPFSLFPRTPPKEIVFQVGRSFCAVL